jgi:exopolysaccharide biosynthesis polyprenyl glycosylphosphotransferase
MNHFLNFKVRMIYFFLLCVVYFLNLYYFDFYDYKSIYLVIFILFLMYYLFDVANFDSYKVRIKKILTSVIINMAVFLLMYFLTRNIKSVYIFFIYTVAQIILKCSILYFDRENIRVLILGYDEIPTLKIVDIIKEKKNKYKYVGYVYEKEEKLENYLGKIEDIEEVVEKNNIQEIIFVSRKQVKVYADLVVKLKFKGITVVDYLGFLEREEGRVDVDKIDDLWVLMSTGFNSFNSKLQKRIKRAFDFIASLILLVVSFPFMIFTYILVKRDGGPAFFKQKRIGMNGKEFEIIKFRSMKVHDPNKFSKYASENDDRITKVGHFIRKTRLDELPQLINVFRGDMSFVGPRPEWNELGHDYEKKIKNYHLRYAVRPGITGWAQTMYFYSSTLEEVKEKLEYDLYYIKYQDLFLDIVVLFKTVKIVIFGKGI